MHCRDGDPAGTRHAEMSNLSILPRLFSLAQTRACRAARDASEERDEASPRLAPLGEGVRREGAHRTRGARREGTPISPFLSAADQPPRVRGDASAQIAHASHDDPQDRSPVSKAAGPRVIRSTEPLRCSRPQDPQAVRERLLDQREEMLAAAERARAPTSTAFARAAVGALPRPMRRWPLRVR